MTKLILVCVFSLLVTIGVSSANDVVTPDTPKDSTDSSTVLITPTANWGKGIFVESRLISSQQVELGLGYSFGMGGRGPLRRAYTGGITGSRLGIVLGLKYVNDEVIFERETSLFYRSDALGPYVGLTFGSPILHDLMSVSTNLKLMYLSRLSSADGRLANDDWGIGIGGSMGFWLYRNMSVDLGMTLEGTQSNPSRDLTGGPRDIPLLQRELRAHFGITTFF